MNTLLTCVSIFYVVLQYFLTPIAADIVQCGGIVLKNKTRIEKYTCPVSRHDDLANYCCDPPKFKCCRLPTFFESVQNVAVFASLGVLCVAILLTALLAVCICSDRCPLHKLVRKHPKCDYIAKPEETHYLTGTAMPTSSSSVQGVRVYEVNSDIKYRQDKDII